MTSRHSRIGTRAMILAQIAALAGAIAGAAAQTKPPVKGAVVFMAGFEGSDPLRRWSGSGSLDAGWESAHSLKIVSLLGASTRGAWERIPLPVESLRGCLIIVSAMVRAENVSPKPQSWNGIKLMVPIETPAGTQWPQARLETGTFDWTRARCSIRVPANATSAVLHLGLEEVTGAVWFDDVRIAVARPPAPAPRPHQGPIYTGHDVPRLRGTMVSPDITEASLRTLGRDWRANVIRWQLVRHARVGQTFALSDYDQWLEGELARLDSALPLCARWGLRVVVDLHSPPGGSAIAGGYTAADADLFSSKACQDKFVEVWGRIARRYRGSSTIWGFDLANEPVEDSLAEGMDDWPALAERAARAIRKIDANRTIIVESASGGGPEGFLNLVPIDVRNVIYSVHMYVPHTFTHQGAFGPSAPVSYPGVIDGKMWDRAQLERALQPVVDFQRKYRVQIYVGEFSAIRWAPDNSAYRYLRDLIDIFEAHGWDWTYHAFREWDGWSVEHGPDRDDHAPAPAPTTREKLLRSWFERNAAPTSRSESGAVDACFRSGV